MIKAQEDIFALIAQRLKEKFSDEILQEIGKNFNELTIWVARDYIVDVLTFLRDDKACLFQSLIDICGVDYPARLNRFEICYHLLSPYKNIRLRVKIETDENHAVPSCCSVYPGADWYEREAYDMYGVIFAGHPDLRRILTDYGFDGHPLRKDFPTTGFVECRYDQEAGRVIYEPVSLRQEIRNFDYLSPWEGMDEPVKDEALEPKV